MYNTISNSKPQYSQHNRQYSENNRQKTLKKTKMRFQPKGSKSQSTIHDVSKWGASLLTRNRSGEIIITSENLSKIIPKSAKNVWCHNWGKFPEGGFRYSYQAEVDLTNINGIPNRKGLTKSTITVHGHGPDKKLKSSKNHTVRIKLKPQSGSSNKSYYLNKSGTFNAIPDRGRTSSDVLEATHIKWISDQEHQTLSENNKNKHKNSSNLTRNGLTISTEALKNRVTAEAPPVKTLIGAHTRYSKTAASTPSNQSAFLDLHYELSSEESSPEIRNNKTISFKKAGDNNDKTLDKSPLRKRQRTQNRTSTRTQTQRQQTDKKENMCDRITAACSNIISLAIDYITDARGCKLFCVNAGFG